MDFEKAIESLLKELPLHKQSRILNKVLDKIEADIEDENIDPLDEISRAINEMVNPASFALSPREHITVPNTHDFHGQTLENTVNIDAFLYTTVQVEQLVEEKKLPSHYCSDCMSHKTEPLSTSFIHINDLIDYISHSASKVQCKFIAETIKKMHSVSEETRILDVGSRFGPLLYAVFYPDFI